MAEIVTKVLEQAEEEDFGMSTLGQVRKDILMELILYFKDISRYLNGIDFIFLNFEIYKHPGIDMASFGMILEFSIMPMLTKYQILMFSILISI